MNSLSFILLTDNYFFSKLLVLTRAPPSWNVFSYCKFDISRRFIQSFDENGVTFSAKDYRTETYHDIHLSLGDFIGRICKHVLPAGFQKIRYYGFLNNRYKNKNLELIFRLQNKTRFKARFEGATVSAIMKEVYGIDIMKCPCCGKSTFQPGRRIYPLREWLLHVNIFFASYLGACLLYQKK